MPRNDIGYQTQPFHPLVNRRQLQRRLMLISSNLALTATFAASSIGIILPPNASASAGIVTGAFLSSPCSTVGRRGMNSKHTQTSEVSSRFFSLLTRTASDNDEENATNNAPTSKSEPVTSDIIRRFTSPVIDDPGLPLSDVLVAQVIAPSLQIAWISVQHAPQPSWLQPIFDTSVLYTNRGALLAPALIHGAALASCWITGALAAKAYERKSISPVSIKSQSTSSSSSPNLQWDYSIVLVAIFQSGAFAIGLLIFATQIDLFLEYKRYVQVGESDDIDFRLLVALVEVINDVVFEAVTITSWRLFLAYQTERMGRD
jgi:hypothetical protein